MAKAYSDDLRCKLIEAHQAGEGSLEALAQRFHVSVGWTKKVSATFRRTGSAARPATRPPGRRSRFGPEIQQQLRHWISEQPDLTLHELQARLRSERGMAASIGRLWSLLREMGLGRKKSHSTRPSKTRPAASSSALSGERKQAESTRTG